MRTWKRSLYPAYRCGACGHTIPADAPYLEYQVPGVSRVLLRCRGCAGEPVPDVLPAALPRAPLALPEWSAVSHLAKSYTAPVQRELPLTAPPARQARFDARLAGIRDAKAAAANDREPGEDD